MQKFIRKNYDKMLSNIKRTKNSKKLFSKIVFCSLYAYSHNIEYKNEILENGLDRLAENYQEIKACEEHKKILFFDSFLIFGASIFSPP